MTDHILPFDIQAEIIKRLPVKSLVRFRLVSKPWKSHIDSSIFINNYHINRKHPQHHVFLQYKQNDGQKYISIIDDNSAFPNQKSSLIVSGPLSLLRKAKALTSVNGLLCFYGERLDVAGQNMAVLWNPTIRKSVGIPIPNALNSRKKHTYIGFGICPNTSDPKLVRINTVIGYKNVDWEAEVYTLSARAWKSVSNIPPAFKSTYLKYGQQVYVGGFIYFGAFDCSRLLGKSRSHLIHSFDLKSDEFGEGCLPDRLVNAFSLGIMKVYESLGLIDNYGGEDDTWSCGMSSGVWVMRGVPKTFAKMYSIKTPYNFLGYPIVELRKKSDAILENDDAMIQKNDFFPVLEVYAEPYSGH